MCTREEFDQTYAVLEQMCGVNILPVEAHTQLVRGIRHNVADIHNLVEFRRVEGLKAVAELQDRYNRLQNKLHVLEQHPVKELLASTEDDIVKQKELLGDVQSNASSRRAYMVKLREALAVEPDEQVEDQDQQILQSQLQFFQTLFPVLFSESTEGVVEGQVYNERSEELVPFRVKKDVAGVQTLWEQLAQSTDSV